MDVNELMRVNGPGPGFEYDMARRVEATHKMEGEKEDQVRGRRFQDDEALKDAEERRR
ncbi:MAG: hypothetical protein AB7V64_11025 [Methanothrix sp.]